MAIKHDTISITAVNHGTTSLTAVHHGSAQVFPDTWTLIITKGNYMATVSYVINSGTAVEVTSVTILTLTVNDSVLVSGTAQNEAPYNYGTPTGTGVFSYSGSASKSTTVECTRTVKEFMISIMRNLNVASITMSRTSSPYGGGDTGVIISNPTRVGRAVRALVYYGDVLEGTAVAATGYHFGASNTYTTDTYTNSGITATDSWSPTVTQNSTVVTIGKPLITATTRFTNSTVWLSTDSSSTSGSTTSATYTYGTVVYGFVKLTNYINNIPSTWTLVSGTSSYQGMPNDVYRTGSYTVSTDDTYDLSSICVTTNRPVIPGRIRFMHRRDGNYRPNITSYGSHWSQYDNLTLGTFTSSYRSLSIPAEASYSGDYSYQRGVSWGTGTSYKNPYYYDYSTGYPEYDELSSPTFTVYRISTAGAQTTIANAVNTLSSTSLSTSYAYIVIADRTTVSSS